MEIHRTDSTILHNTSKRLIHTYIYKVSSSVYLTITFTSKIIKKMKTAL